MVRIIDVITGVRPSELRFETREAAQEWLDSYRVDSAYKAEHYRIVEEESARKPFSDPRSREFREAANSVLRKIGF